MLKTTCCGRSTACFLISDYEHDLRIRDLHYRCYNFQAWHLSAIGLVGLALRDTNLVDYAVNSRYGFKHLLAHDIRDDGTGPLGATKVSWWTTITSCWRFW